MCIRVHQIFQCPPDGTPPEWYGYDANMQLAPDPNEHHVWSLHRCSSPRPCRSGGFGTVTETYSLGDACPRCLGSVVGARSTTTPDLVATTFAYNEWGGDLVDNVASYVGQLLEFALLALIESLAPPPGPNNFNLYPIEQLLRIALAETTCLRCREPQQCRCRPGRNEGSWNVARQARSFWAKESARRLHERVSGEALGTHAVAVRRHVERELDDAVQVMGRDNADAVSYDVEPVDLPDTRRRFLWIAADLLDAHRGGHHHDSSSARNNNDDDNDDDDDDDDDDDGGGIMSEEQWNRLSPEDIIQKQELCVKFDLMELMATIVAHDPGVPDQMVPIIGSRWLPIVILTRESLRLAASATTMTASPLPDLRNAWDTLTFEGDVSGTTQHITFPVADILQDGTFLPALFEAIQREALFIQSLYDGLAQQQQHVLPSHEYVVTYRDGRPPRLQGNFEMAVKQVHKGLRVDNEELVDFEANRQAYWRRLLHEVPFGVQWLTRTDKPPGQPDSQCIIHLNQFWEEMEIEDYRYAVAGGELEPMPRFVHRPIRFHNCVRDENMHAFCICSLSEWVFNRDMIDDKYPRVVGMKERTCLQCRRHIVMTPAEQEREEDNRSQRR